MLRTLHSSLQGLKLWFLWNIVTDLGLALSLYIGVFAVGIIGLLDASQFIAFTLPVLALSGFLGGIAAGICQWVVLRSKIERAGRWIWATTIGWVVLESSLAVMLAFIPAYNLSSAFFTPAVVGGVLGLAQWLVLRDEVHRAGWWILVSVVGWVGAVFATTLLADTGLNIALGLPVGLSIMGMVTGIAIVYYFEETWQKSLSLRYSSGLTFAIILLVGVFVKVAYSQQKFTLRGHMSAVNVVAFSPDGATLASGSFDNTIKLWDVTSEREIYTLSGHTRVVESVAFSPDGNTLASGSSDHTVRLWDVTSGMEIRTLQGHNRSVHSVVFFPDGSMLASAGCCVDEAVRIWDVSTGKELQVLDKFSMTDELIFTPEGRLIASEVNTRSEALWDVMSGEEFLEFRTPLYVTSYALSPDGLRLAIGHIDSSAIL